jgi:hypothetical protein
VQAYDDDIKRGGFEFLSFHGRRASQTIISSDGKRRVPEAEINSSFWGGCFRARILTINMFQS